MKQVKVLYFAGWGRSGTTLLGNIMGQLDGYLNVGELYYLWDRGLQDGQPCGCGDALAKCVVWHEIGERAFGGWDTLDAARFQDMRNHGLRTRHLPMLRFAAGRQAALDRTEAFREALSKLYRAIVGVTGCKVIVDTSKFPSYAYLLGHCPGIDLYTTHLVRDPRAVAYSWWSRSEKMTTLEAGKIRNVHKHHPLTSSILWNAWNHLLKQQWKRESMAYQLVNYEQFMNAPEVTVRRIADFARHVPNRSPFVESHEVHVEPCHSVSGNPNRFRQGNLKLRLDNEWETKMSSAMQLTVSTITMFNRPAFGY
ncbi:MAG: sulfotransferase domain-containing protein [Planctomycetota bacterium]